MKKRRSFIRKWGVRTLFIVGACFMLFIAGVYVTSFLLGPPPINSDKNTIYYSDDGSVIGEEKGVENRHWINLEDMSSDLVDATLLIEDQHFFKHNGFDLKRIVGAAIRDLQHFSLKEGASTLTQQYARNLYLTQEKTWTRKLKEAFYTIRLEMFYSKKEILEGYLNTIYYGHGAYGIEAASKLFFNKSANSLSLAESAMLAGIPKGPTYYSPINDPERAKKRQELILSQMKNENIISPQGFTNAKNEPLLYATKEETKRTGLGSYFQDTVIREAAGILQLDIEAVKSGGYHIYTTMDKAAQQMMEKRVQETVPNSTDMQIGAIAMMPDSGQIKALIGGKNYKDSPYNRAIVAKRMPGSAFKPFLYYAALENGYTATTKVMSKPTAFTLENGNVYQPSNYNGYYAYEPITLAQALALSDNIYAVKTILYLGEGKLTETARKFGITSELPAVPSLALGTASVSVLEMVRGYAMLANGGMAVSAHTIERIVDYNGKEIYKRAPHSSEKVLDAQKTFILSQLMTGMFDESLNGYMPVTGSTITDQLTREYAGKSGTTSSDNWMIGFSPDLVTGIWTGYDDNRAIEKVAEQSYAKKIWANFMEEAHEGKPEQSFKEPKGVIGIPIDPTTGERATPYCPTRTVMYFIAGNEPTESCTIHLHEEKKEENESFEKWFDMFLP
ncbi:PBP1A family penicillin-binding protein [Virgibacillus sp. LDC-1]|uniref:transglycosylase domain-containing protein n=1 Tax=Virgibacillus sp. LDC-1 TaxID=3039856 RepID=UPI0024DEE9E4|nr:PBP1A family penicillin-binding protein [Virgibacillus sp. LDC-1]